MSKLSRSKLARYVADEIIADRTSAAVAQLAAYLVESRRTREADVMVRAIYDELEQRGIVVSTVTSRAQLADGLSEHIKQLTGARELHLTQTIDPSVIAGLRVETPSRLMDATVAHRLTKLREIKQ